MTSKIEPAQIGPAMRPRLIKELLNPMATPWPPVARLEIREKAAGRNRVLDRMKKPVASRILLRQGFGGQGAG